MLFNRGISKAIHMGVIPGAVNRSIAGHDLQTGRRNLLVADQRQIVERDPFEEEVGILLALPQKIVERLLFTTSIFGFSKHQQKIARKVRGEIL